MNRHLIRKHVKTAASVFTIGIAATMWTTAVRAGCADIQLSEAAGEAHSSIPVVYRTDAPTPFQFMRTSDQRMEHAAIVGLWKFEMLAKSTSAHTNPMPDGALIDFGYATWHDDGTELMNSGNMNPGDSNFCMGVWKQVGPTTYRLGHHPLAWHNGVYAGPVTLLEEVVLDKNATSYTGVFLLTVYSAAAIPGQEFNENLPVATITGTVTATRVTVN